jgi:hypothetical protein
MQFDQLKRREFITLLGVPIISAAARNSVPAVYFHAQPEGPATLDFDAKMKRFEKALPALATSCEDRLLG